MTKYDDNQKVEYFGLGVEDGIIERNKKAALAEIREAVLRCEDRDVLMDGAVRDAVKYLQRHMTRPEIGDRLLASLGHPDQHTRFEQSRGYYHKIGDMVS